MKQISELRQDLVTGDWVVVATGRARRPQDFGKQKGVIKVPKTGCPFETLLPELILAYDHSGRVYGPKDVKREISRNWWLQVVSNKFPAFGPGQCKRLYRLGPHRVQDGVGFHEVIITRDHHRSPGEQSAQEVAILLSSYRERYRLLAQEPCVEYVSIFHNHGQEAGASIYHPHSQIIAIPVVPPDVGRSLFGSAGYFRLHQKCVHCTMISFEIRSRRRIVYSNRHFVAFAPYVSRSAFEVRIFPRVHNSNFETSSDEEIRSCAEALSAVLGQLHRRLNNPAYNFFIHTAPVADHSRYNYYHWHIEILPKTAVWAGFEIGTGIEISTIAPETAAQFLRKAKINE